jgi:ADP-ribose pyrophosphatase YjhB (NUDIX family)
LVQAEQKLRKFRWLEWAREIQALTQTGLHYSQDHYNQERYHRLQQIAAEIIAEHTSLDLDDLTEVFQQQIGYATPRVDVRGAVFQEGKLLLVRERLDGGWTMPGGWADVGDTPSAGVEREVWEEAGFRVKTRQIVGIYDANRIFPLEVFHAYKIVFLCDILSGGARISNETSEVAFFSESEIPEMLSGERTSPRHIRDAFQACAQSGFPAVFD